jgi:hypothetical protein
MRENPPRRQRLGLAEDKPLMTATSNSSRSIG